MHLCRVPRAPEINPLNAPIEPASAWCIQPHTTDIDTQAGAA